MVRTIVLFLTVLLLGPVTVEAQHTGKVPRIGVLGEQAPATGAYTYALRDGLRELGYIEGKNISIDWQWAHGKTERFPDLAAELVKRNVDVIVAPNNPAVAAALRATKTVPIIMAIVSDPVGLGFIANLARPGGNVTGLTIQAPELAAKRLQLVREVVPKVGRIAVLWVPIEKGRLETAKETELAAKALGMKLQLFEIRDPEDIDSAFTAMTRDGTDAIRVEGSTLLFAHIKRIADLAVQRRLATMCPVREYVEAGCLMSYGANFTDLVRRTAYFVDKVLKGAKPAELPVEQPTKFELAINAKTAKALGLTLAPSLLLRADQIIQ